MMKKAVFSLTAGIVSFLGSSTLLPTAFAFNPAYSPSTLAAHRSLLTTSPLSKINAELSSSLNHRRTALFSVEEKNDNTEVQSDGFINYDPVFSAQTTAGLVAGQSLLVVVAIIAAQFLVSVFLGSLD